jgi:hypothetical protein
MAAGAASEGTFLQLKDGRFIDDRWVGGRWDLSKFRTAAGEQDWDAVIDAGGWTRTEARVGARGGCNAAQLHDVALAKCPCCWGQGGQAGVSAYVSRQTLALHMCQAKCWHSALCWFLQSAQTPFRC